MRAFIALALLCLGYVHTRSLKDVDLNELDDTLVKIKVQVGKLDKEIKAELKKKGGNGGEETGTGVEEKGTEEGEGEEGKEEKGGKGAFDISDHIFEVNMKEHKEKDLMEGDMMVKPEQITTYKGVQGDLVKEESKHWPISGQVVNIPYVYDGSASPAARNAFAQAIQDFRIKTCIRFIPRSTQGTYLRFVSESGCWSYVGKLNFGGVGQKVSLGRRCETKGIAIHELMHAIGYYHEQSRPDRNNFVQINYGNIKSQFKSNFDIKETDNQGTAYDYNSVMHYGPKAFSRNGRPTIQLKRGKKGRIGQRNGFSPIDLKSINAKYCAKSTCYDRLFCPVFRAFCNARFSWFSHFRNVARTYCKASCNIC